MNPNKTPLLFNDVAAPAIPKVLAEFNRRAVVSTVMGELDIAFKNVRKIGSISDPLIVARLLAIRSIQFSELGLSGFDPMETVGRHGRHVGTVRGFAAPAHDTYLEDDLQFKTRTIKFEMPESDFDSDSDIVIIGLNLYISDGDQSSDILGAVGQKASGLILATPTGEEATVDGEPITGDISIFAVYNRQTNDAKIYKVSQPNPEETEMFKPRDTNVVFKDNTAYVLLSNGTMMKVEELRDNPMLEMMSEFDASIAALGSNTQQSLSEEDRRAIRLATGGY